MSLCSASFLEKYKHNNGELSCHDVPADAMHLLRAGKNGSSIPGSSWNTGEILPQFERPAIVVKGARMDNDRLIPDHEGDVSTVSTARVANLDASSLAEYKSTMRDETHL